MSLRSEAFGLIFHLIQGLPSEMPAMSCTPSLVVADPARPAVRTSVLRRRSWRLAWIAAPRGDGASRPGVADVPRLVVVGRRASGAEAWRARVEAAQAEAQAALHVPFSPPATWEP